MSLRAIGVAMLGWLASSATAQWTIIHLHPQGATESEAHAIDGD